MIGFSEVMEEQISSHLAAERYDIKSFRETESFTDFLGHNKEQIDCLLGLASPAMQAYLGELTHDGLLLPVVILQDMAEREAPGRSPEEYYYHSAERYLTVNHLENLDSAIDQAIAQFLHLAPSCALKDKPTKATTLDVDDSRQAFLLLQQRRLAEKLRERLGYLGVYYKRNPKYFYRNLTQEEQDAFKQQFMADYREIVLDYFNGTPPTNQAIDQFVNQAFFADISVSYILETHMTLMDEFAQQLKLEGRSEEILLDYRLTLIDIVAHLCEMYRRSIPREDLPFELLFRMD